MTSHSILIRGAREHNLKNIDLDIPREQFVVITGLSGSGKTSLAFDTLYAEGQRRFMESLSAYARQFLGMMERPEVDFIDGLSPVISIDQRTTSRNPRSTVGTVTEIYDYLRLLFARAALPYSYVTGRPMKKQTPDEVVTNVLNLPTGSRAYCLAPVVRGRKGHYRDLFEQLIKQGFIRVRIDGVFHELEKNLQADRYKTHNIEVVVDRFVISEKSRKRIEESIQMALEMADGNLVLAVEEKNTPSGYRDLLFSQNLFDPESGLSYDEPAPNLFSFNSPYGACPDCSGLGYRYDVDINSVIPDPSLSIREGALRYPGAPNNTLFFNQLKSFLNTYGYTFDTPVSELPPDVKQILLEGSGEERFKVSLDFRGGTTTYAYSYPGIFPLIRKEYHHSSSKKRNRSKTLMKRVLCTTCEGGRLKKEALSYKIGGYTIHQLVKMDLYKLRETIGRFKLNERQQAIASQILKEIRDRLDFLLNVGLHYLSLDREAQTISGGEAQRIRLATQIGTQLVGVLYILDEPSIGLHPRDNLKLIRSLKLLRDLGNSVIVVEHDRETIQQADYVIDMGPGAGRFGGHIVTKGTPDQLDPNSLTARYLRYEKIVPVPDNRRKGNGRKLIVTGMRGHNLKNITLQLPLGTFICVTGVSGSGKSTLINHTLVPVLSAHYQKSKTIPLPYSKATGIEHLNKVISIDQSPIGRTPRSNPGTYTKVFDQIRMLFAELPESKIRGYGPGRFSFNVKGGRCEACRGDGVRKIEMNFLPDVYVPCESCKGKRYNRETLDIHYKGKNIGDFLDMAIEEAAGYFDAVPKIKRIFDTMISVGLGYLTLGQSSTTISGGEAQRIKLARELSKIGTGDTLYVMDEPTTGLHFQDVTHLVKVIQKLVHKGNTVIVIEHNMDLIMAADHLIDMGPDGGDKGGKIIATGTPETLANDPESATGRALREEFRRSAAGAGISALSDK